MNYFTLIQACIVSTSFVPTTATEWECFSPHRCFLLVQQQLKWNDARAYCRSLGNADLATIYSVEENRFIADNILTKIRWSTCANVYPSVWHGLADIEGNPNGGTWSSGGVSAYRNWYKNTSEPTGGPESCGTFYATSNLETSLASVHGTWNDYSCTCLYPPLRNWDCCPNAFLCEQLDAGINVLFQRTTATLSGSESHHVALRPPFPTTGIQHQQLPRKGSCANLDCSTRRNGQYADPLNACSPYFFMCSNGLCYLFDCPADHGGKFLYYNQQTNSCLRKHEVSVCSEST